MKEILRYGFILAFICTTAAGLLASVNSLTKSRIISQAEAEEKASLKEVVAEADYFKPLKSQDELIYYQALNKTKKLIAVVFKAQAKGYSDTVETLVGMRQDGTIIAIKVLSQNETPGLGARISEPAFTEQFRDKKDLGDVQAITGATVSSQAVIDSVKKKAQEIISLIKK